MREPIRVFIGFDERETVAAHVLAHSIQRHTTEPVLIGFLALHQLRDEYWRGRDSLQSTDFAYTRFLVPYLCNYQGRAIFMDCDMLCRSDLSELWEMTKNGKALNVVKHDYLPKLGVKFLSQPQTIYPRKNWSSLMVFDNAQCTDLRVSDVSRETGMFLHRFQWLKDDQIGEIPFEWNHLVDEYGPNPDAKLVHFTRGGPYFKEYEHCEFAGEWFAEFQRMCHCEDPAHLGKWGV